jgi:hypothetical protein
MHGSIDGRDCQFSRSTRRACNVSLYNSTTVRLTVQPITSLKYFRLLLQIVADKDTLTTGASVGRVLLGPLDVPCASHKLVIQDRNRTVDVMLPCGGGATGRIGSFHTQRERLLYISDSDTLNIYLKPPLGAVGAASAAAAATTRSSAVGHHLHQYLYLLKFQGIL